MDILPANRAVLEKLAIRKRTGIHAPTLTRPRYAADFPDTGINRQYITSKSGQATFFCDLKTSIRTGDVLYLYFSDDATDPVARRDDLNAGDSNNEVAITIPAVELLRFCRDNTTARVNVWFIVIANGNAIESFKLENYLIDFQPPGGIPTPDPPPGDINSDLAKIPQLDGNPRPEPIPTPGVPFLLSIPVWLNQTAGDKLYVRWGTQPVLGPFTLNAADLGKPYWVTIPPGLIGAQSDKVDYYIRDVVNNTSYYSPPQDSLSDGDDGGGNPDEDIVDWENAPLGAGHSQATVLAYTNTKGALAVDCSIDVPGDLGATHGTLDIDFVGTPGKMERRVYTSSQTVQEPLKKCITRLSMRKGWRKVTLYVTSIHRDGATYSFQDRYGNVIGDIHNFPWRPTDPQKVIHTLQAQVPATSEPIAKIEIRSWDRIRVDFLTMTNKV